MIIQSIPTTTHRKEDLRMITSGQQPLIRWRRTNQALDKAVIECLNTGFQRFKMEGSPSEIHTHLGKEIPDMLATDVLNLLEEFCLITGETKPLLELSVVTDNRCRRFHTDLTDYRLLCTYAGPTTLWIVDPEGLLDERKGLDEAPEGFEIDQADEQDVLLFAGAMALTEQGTPLLHKSPALLAGQRRLMLRLDTQCFVSIVKGFTG